MLAWVLAVAACKGADPGGDANAGNAGEDPSATPASTEVTGEGALASISGLRRLSVNEYDNTITDLLEDGSRSGTNLLPQDGRSPFDNEYKLQAASQALIEGAETLAGDAAQRLVADHARRDKIVGCTPSAPGDASCFRTFVERFGQLALRRSLTAEESTAMMELLPLAVESGDFYAAVDTAVRTFLQNPWFLYRVEIGQDVGNGVYKLSGVELASRLSYLLWGSMPDKALLGAAEAGQLDTPEGRRGAAVRMLDDARARARIGRFHALWLGYENLKLDPVLATAMQAETQALLDRVIFQDKRSWLDIFRADETYVTAGLAAHYALPEASATGPTWVKYGATPRQGILSHGTFLSNGAKFSDTSPTMRGLAVRTRLFCQTMAPPPPGVNADEPPAAVDGKVCKKDKYAAHASGGCKGCHQQMDPVGFGLEGFDQQGRYRTHETGQPDCTIDGKGELVGVGAFEGPKGLANVALQSGLMNACVVTQFYRFAIGRSELDDADRMLVKQLAEKIGKGDFRFDDLLLEYVASTPFGFRRAETKGSGL